MPALKQSVNDRFDEIPYYSHTRSDRRGLKREFLVIEKSLAESNLTSELLLLLENAKKEAEKGMRGRAFLASPVTQKDVDARDNYFFNLALTQTIAYYDRLIAELK